MATFMRRAIESREIINHLFSTWSAASCRYFKPPESPEIVSLQINNTAGKPQGAGLSTRKLC